MLRWVSTDMGDCSQTYTTQTNSAWSSLRG